MSLLSSERVILLVDSLYSEAIEAVKSRAALSASSYELIWTLGKINSEAKFWNLLQSVNFLTGSQIFLLRIWSSKWKTIGRWSESRMPEAMTSESRTFLCTTILSTISPFSVGEYWVGHCGAEISSSFICSKFSSFEHSDLLPKSTYA
jgi:hypothetical protein